MIPINSKFLTIIVITLISCSPFIQYESTIIIASVWQHWKSLAMPSISWHLPPDGMKMDLQLDHHCVKQHLENCLHCKLALSCNGGFHLGSCQISQRTIKSVSAMQYIPLNLDPLVVACPSSQAPTVDVLKYQAVSIDLLAPATWAPAFQLQWSQLIVLAWHVNY